MSTDSPAILAIETDRARRGSPRWIWRGLVSLVRYSHTAACLKFVSVLGAISRPGMFPIGHLQAWALRRIGVRCASNQIWFGRDLMIDFPQNLSLGRRVVVGAHASLTARGELTIGDDFLSAPGLMINTGSHDPATLAPNYAPVRIGPGVWCGLRVTICTGVTIGAGAVVGAGSVVVGDLPARHIALGVPCKPRREVPRPPPGAKTWSNFPA